MAGHLSQISRVKLFVLFTENQKRRLNRHRLAGFDENSFDNPLGFGFYFKSRLVCFNLKQDIIPAYAVPGRNPDIDQRTLFHCLSQLGQNDFFGHDIPQKTLIEP